MGRSKAHPIEPSPQFRPSSEHPRKFPEVCLTHKKKLGSSEGSYLGVFHGGGTAAVPSVKVQGARFWRDKRKEILQGLGFREDRSRIQAGI